MPCCCCCFFFWFAEQENIIVFAYNTNMYIILYTLFVSIWYQTVLIWLEFIQFDKKKTEFNLIQCKTYHFWLLVRHFKFMSTCTHQLCFEPWIILSRSFSMSWCVCELTDYKLTDFLYIFSVCEQQFSDVFALL